MNESEIFCHFSVKKLFGRFDHEIPVPTSAGQTRYISAPNGSGKSTVLRMITCAAEGNWSKLAEITFSQADFEFTSGTKLQIARSLTGNVLALEVSIHSSKGNEISWTPNIDAPELDESALPPYVFKHRRPLRPDRAFSDMRTGRFYSADGVARQFLTPPKERSPDAIASLLARLRVFYLDANRLRNTESDELSVEIVSKVIEDAIDKARIDYGNQSRKQETTFPSRLIAQISKSTKKKTASLDNLSTRYVALTHEDKRFRDLSLTDGELKSINTTKWKQSQASQAESVLGLWLEDLEGRFQGLSPLADRLEMFRDTLNQMLTAKRVSFRAASLKATDEVAQNSPGALMVSDLSGKEISLSALSSGEQHLIVMLGRVMFDPAVPSGTLVLLDEPEISLHPDWQTTLSTTLRKVAVVSDIRVILATHSPLIVNGDWSDETWWRCE